MAKDRKADPDLFVQSIKDSNNTERNYLGDPTVVETILRYAASEFFDSMEDTSDAGALALVLGKRHLKPLVFPNKHYIGVRGWNKRGVIDVFAAKWKGIDANGPMERMGGLFVMLIDELLELVLYAGEDGVRDEDWQFQVDHVFLEYTNILLGISPPMALQFQ